MKPPSLPGFGGTSETGPPLPRTSTLIWKMPLGVSLIFTFLTAPGELLYEYWKPTVPIFDQPSFGNANVWSEGVPPFAITSRVAPFTVGSPTSPSLLPLSSAWPLTFRLLASVLGFLIWNVLPKTVQVAAWTDPAERDSSATAITAPRMISFICPLLRSMGSGSIWERPSGEQAAGGDSARGHEGCGGGNLGGRGRGSRGASARADVEVRAGEHLVHLEDVRAAEHLARRAARVGLGEVLALGPGDEVGEGPPPGLHLVVALPVRILRPGAALVVELHRPRAVHLVADEAGMAVHEMDAPPEAVLEVDLMAPGDGDAVGHDDHGVDP